MLIVIYDNIWAIPVVLPHNNLFRYLGVLVISILIQLSEGQRASMTCSRSKPICGIAVIQAYAVRLQSTFKLPTKGKCHQQDTERSMIKWKGPRGRIGLSKQTKHRWEEEEAVRAGRMWCGLRGAKETFPSHAAG